MIEIKNLVKTYGDRVVVDIPELTINNGECIVLTGHNGSGKSTLMKILAGITNASEGSFHFDGILRYLPQQSLPFNKSVKGNILYILDGKRADKTRKCDAILEKLKLTHLQKKNALTLSGGEAQRLALGRVLAKKCDVLLLDEPTSAADTESAKLILETIDEYRKETGCILIITTHNKEEAERIGGRRINLCDGRITDIC